MDKWTKCKGYMVQRMDKNRLNIAILYIALGKYSVLWKEFYESCEKFFLLDENKHYYIWTDDESIKSSEKITVIKQHDMGWPKNTLMRFYMFNQKKEELEKYNYIFFFNANLKFLKEVGNDLLPQNEQLLVTLHPTYYKEANPDKYPYYRNPSSTAYIPYGKGQYYVQGALFGGKGQAFLEMTQLLEKATQVDLDNDIIADVHDESQLNKYIVDRNDLKVVGPEYIYPEGYDLDIEPIILSRDKSKYFDVETLKYGKSKKVKHIIKKIIHIFKNREN